MNTNSNKFRLAVFLLSAILANSAVAQNTWEVVQIRGAILSNKKLMRIGFQLDSADVIRFSKSSDIMALRKVSRPEFTRLVRPKDFDLGLDSAFSCSAASCPAVWAEPMIVSSFNHVENRMDEHGNVETIVTTAEIPRPTSLEEYWENVQKNIDHGSTASIHTLAPGSKLLPGQFLVSKNEQYQLMYQPDGNLVLYRLSDGLALWHTGTNGFEPGRCEMQTDGNLIIYNAAGKAIWSTNILGEPYQGSSLTLYINGNLLLKSAKNIWWESRTFEGSANTNTAGYSQLWARGGNINPSPEERYTIVAGLDDKALVIPDPKLKKDANPSSGNTNQRWQLERQQKTFYTLRSEAGNVLEAQQSVVQVADYTGQANQLWDLVPAGDGWFYLRNGLGFYLEKLPAAKTKGTKIRLDSFSGSNAQKWKLVP